MYPPKVPLAPNTPVYVELPAEIIGLADPKNPYWYLVRLGDGSVHTVEIRHINRQADEVSAVSGADGSLTFRNANFSRQGVEDLAEYVRIHRQTYPMFEQQEGKRHMQFTAYRAIRFQGVVSLVALHPDDPNRLHWNGGRAYMTGVEGEHYETLKEYQLSDFAGDEDALEISYRREYYKPMPMDPINEPCGGWIAPDGKLYECGNKEHDSVGMNLSAWFYDKMLGIGELLERHWVHLYTNGCLMYRDKEQGLFTQLQLDTLETLREVAQHAAFDTRRGIEEYRNAMAFETRHATVVEW